MSVANSLKEKVHNLPLLCVESIFKFTPSSQLFRLHSNAVPLPGAFWSFGLDAVLKKRMPLSLQNELPFDNSEYHAKALFDVAGAKIAAVKDPETFRFCSLLEFIESATLTVRVLSSRWTVGHLPLYVVHSEALLAHTPNVKYLALSIHASRVLSSDKGLHELSLEHLLPQLQYFAVSISADFWVWSDSRMEDEACSRLVNALRIDEMSCLRRFVLPEVAFNCVAGTTADRLTRMQAVLASLSSLGIGHNLCYINSRACFGQVALNFVALNCGRLSQLQVVVHSHFSEYLAAFRALPGLTSLGLHVVQADPMGPTFDESGAISSVTDFRIVCRPYVNRSCVRKMIAFFPNATMVAVKAGYTPDPLQLATSLFDEMQFFPAAAKLGCFFSGNNYDDDPPARWRQIFSCSSQLLTQFLTNPHLPEAVDLSQISFQNLTRDFNLLTEIYCAMQGSSIKSLSMRGPVNRESLARLQSHIDLKGESSKVSAWANRDLDDQPGISDLLEISQQTDIQIVGLKTSGNLKGERFTLRVCHQLAKHVDIFD